MTSSNPRFNKIAILEPRPEDSPGQVSGGFLYNRSLERASLAGGGGRIERLGLDPARPLQGQGLPPGYDLVLVDSLFWYLRPAPLADLRGLPGLAGARLGVLCHGVPPNPGFQADLGGVDLAVCPSFHLVRELSAALSSRRPRFLVLYPGFDTHEGLERLTLREGEKPIGPCFRILTVANWNADKGYAEMAAALRILGGREPRLSWEWRVCGVEDAALIQEVRGGLGAYSGRLRILGLCRGPDLLRELEEADVFFLMSKKETFCMALYEATIAGLPALVSGVGGMDEARSLGLGVRRALSGGAAAAPGQAAAPGPEEAAAALGRIMGPSRNPAKAPRGGQPATPVMPEAAAGYRWLARAKALLAGEGDLPAEEGVADVRF